uniref:ATP synthase subunit gamma, mitochondrial-like isoform X2 n=1 Tax=Ciona intestinalis TaxID=7719 RepID=UPI000180C76E|nr:ATP synthase subunit gamma, mitochondrial-like isoform X2 [Ciona intestinalis]|eukprot:XP_018670674.1 ATP synthase subunit gamma, mitochondrial-like isoform X2 [Ciona intestinalis]
MMNAASKASVYVPQLVQVRHSSGKLKELGIRLKAIKNIQKITKTMKMISAAKFAQASKAIIPARAYGVGALAVYDKAKIESEARPKQVYIGVSSDRGLCGALHSNIGRALKSKFEEQPDNVETKVVTVGDKVKVFLQSGLSDSLLLECKELGRLPPSFNDSAVIAEDLLESGYEFQQGEVFYNWFKSAMTQIIKQQPFFSVEVINQSPTITVYDSLDEDVLKSYQEFQLANTLYYTMKENYTSEQGARMISMDGATKNAGMIYQLVIMINRMSLLYNGTRQAVKTTELTEIISGVAALE